jgi:hypothetical protein
MRVALSAGVTPHDQHTLAMQRDARRECATRRGWTVLDARADLGAGAAEQRPKRRELFHAARQDAVGMRGWQRDRWGRSLVEVSGDRVRFGDLLWARRAGRPAAKSVPPRRRPPA